jgi:hypothetical protein
MLRYSKRAFVYWCVAFVWLSTNRVASAASKMEEVLTKIIVVRATVTERTDDSNASTSVQRIDHLYCGVPIGGATTFRDSSTDGDSANGTEVTPSLKVGQSGIWLLRSSEDGQFMFRKAYAQLGIVWPVRPAVAARYDGDARYENVVILAEALEKVWKARTDRERIELLTGFVESDVAELSVAAIILLAEGTPETLAKYATRSQITNLSHQAQAALDEEMFAVDGKRWKESDVRKRLLDHWSKANGPGMDTQALLRHLDRAIQRKQIDAAELLPILNNIIVNESQPEVVRRMAVGSLRWIVKDEKVGKDVVSFLCAILEKDISEFVQLTAAQSVSQVKSVGPEQLATLMLLKSTWSVKAAEAASKNHLANEIARTLEELLKRLRSSKNL